MIGPAHDKAHRSAAAGKGGKVGDWPSRGGRNTSAAERLIATASQRLIGDKAHDSAHQGFRGRTHLVSPAMAATTPAVSSMLGNGINFDYSFNFRSARLWAAKSALKAIRRQ
jgi:hypothetical protein